MSEVKRHVTWFPSEIGGDMLENVVRASDFDAAQSELAALREELVELKEIKEYATIPLRERCAERKDMQQRLTAAEQRNAELVELLGDARWRIVNKNTSTDDYKRLDKPVVDRIDAALKPTESGASE